MGSSVSIHQIMKKKYKTFGFSQRLVSIIGDAEEGFKALVFGESGNGKTTFCALLCKDLSEYGKVYYNSVEQGEGKSIQDMAKHCKLDECAANSFVIGDRDNYGEMLKKIKANRCKFVVIDSAQYMNLTVEQYKEMTVLNKKKSFIIISWADGQSPKGEAAKAMRYMVDVKIRVHKGVAYVDSRFGATDPYKIPGLFEKFHKAKLAQDESKHQPSLFDAPVEANLN